ncbi:MAG: HAD family phosphatase [Puia sp.]|nr:HAD family phosphatase [Puia sp.]
MKPINTLVFDLGSVLIDWNPHYLYSRIIPDENERKWFFENICTMEWNEEQDGGRSLQEGTELLVEKFPAHEKAIRAYYDHWDEMLGDSIKGTVELFRHLKATTNMKFYALTNWSAETFPLALARYEFLHWFDGRIVSGEENTRKPFEKMYRVLIEKFRIEPSQAVFIDDNARNLAPARELGFHTIHFRSSEQLTQDLKALGVS